jgi:hypothetical protein
MIDNVGAELRRLWSVRVAAFWSLVCGLILIWPGSPVKSRHGSTRSARLIVLSFF